MADHQPVQVPRSTEVAPEPARTRGELRVLTWRGSDGELLEELKRDLRRGAALLHDRFAPVVNRLVWRLLGPDPDHDDLVQQIFIQLITRARRVRDAEKLPSWVQSVAVNAVYSELRKRAVRRLFWQQQSRTLAFDAGQSLESRDLLLKVYRVLDQLPTTERMIFVLRYFDERPLKEVAELCQCSLATAKRRLGRANHRFETLARRYPEILTRFSSDRSED